MRRCNRHRFASRLVIAGVDPRNGQLNSSSADGSETNELIRHARVAELADAPDLGSGGATRGGSTPPFRTNNLLGFRFRPLFDFALHSAPALHCEVCLLYTS